MAKAANTPERTEAWLEILGSTFVEVRMWLPGVHGRTHWGWINERHIADPQTLLTTVSMSLERLGGRFAVWQDGEEWELFDRRTSESKIYPSREAAEMVAMHRRG